MPAFFWSIVLGLALASAQLSASAVTALQPSRDDEVIEVLPVVTRSRPAPVASASGLAPAAAAVQARQAIAVARQTGDTRYWGRAQAVLAPWWGKPDAPAELAILQATVQQGRHEFEASRKVLTATLARAPGNAQGWLNLAALERLSARYAEALLACDAVARAGQALYAAACRLETQSLQGQYESAAQGLQALIDRSPDRGQRSWLLSLLAESLERRGRDSAAAQAYASSLALDPDLYTTIAYSDLLLRSGKSSQALQALAVLPETDAVLLRCAAAWRRLGDARWIGAREQLREREAELQRRGDDPALHGRELALTALWLDDDAPRALELARRNLLLQREPLDWWVAVQSAQQAKNAKAQAEIAHALRAAGLHDSRLAAALPNPSSPTVKGAK
ncbi:hypothetical protein LP417_25230 [Polaromonas sp. P1-6]|nr:hypothetical protein LP417_25230 [Polaromonas sp. P1-6]